MPNYFLTKTWGFNPATHPVLGISDFGARRTFLRNSSENDWVLIAGTAQPPTKNDERGRLLGIVRLGRNEVDTEDVLNRLGTPIHIRDRDKNHRYLWPYALPMLEAYRFVDKPLISSVFGDGLPGFAWVKNLRNISNANCHLNDALAAIEELRKERVEIAEIPEFKRQEYQQRMLAAGITGPGPASNRSAGSVKVGTPVTYCLKMSGTKRIDVFKVGFTNNLDRRHKELNQGLVSTITGFGWDQYAQQAQESGINAYICEQRMHEALSKYRVNGEREIYKLPEKELLSVWNNTVAETANYMSPEALEKYAQDYDALLASDGDEESDSGIR